MAGVYIHIPFCRSKCIYCDFYSITDNSFIDKYVDALLLEMEHSPHNVGQIDTIFIGGGTPSLLQSKGIQRILDEISHKYNISNNAEITIESNPESLSEIKLSDYKSMGINRLSIGFQSLQNSELKFLGRPHNSKNAINIYNLARSAGFDNINIDMIYGIPGQTPECWHDSLKNTIILDPEHISAYNLIYEEGTKLTKMAEENNIIKIEEEQEKLMYENLCNMLNQAGYEHYEISNFAKQGKKCKHNLNYWNREDYIGFGPFAHSFINSFRFFNDGNIENYFEDIFSGKLPNSQPEKIEGKDILKEKVMLGLRSEGISNNLVNQIQANDLTEILILNNLAEKYDDTIVLSNSGYFISDEIILEFFKIIDKI